MDSSLKNPRFPAFLALITVMFLSACGGPTRDRAQEIPQDDTLQTLLERQVLTNILAERRIAGIRGPLLEEDGDLIATARAHSIDMASRGFFSHVNPEGEGPLVRHRKRVTFVHGRIGENIWSAQLVPGQEPNLGALARRCVTGWMGSPSHRALLLDQELTKVGVGVAFSEEWVYVTLLMQTP